MAKSLKLQAGLLAASRAAGQVLNALVSFVAARALLQEDFGTFRQIYLLFTTLLLITDLGFSESLYYFLPKYPERAGRYVARALMIVGPLQFVVGTGLFLFREAIGRSFDNPALAAVLPLFAFFLGFSVVTRLWEVQLISQQRIVAAGLVTGGFEAFKALLLFAVLFIEPSIHWIVWALVVATGAKVLCFLVFLAREKRPDIAGQIVTSEFMNYSLALWIPGAVNVLAMQAHQFLVGFSFTPEEFAVYSVACFQLPMLAVLTTSVIEVMLVRITAAHGAGRHEEVVQVWNAATAQSMVFFIPLVLALAAMAVPLITLLFTARYVSAAPLFAILTLSLPLTAIYTNNVLRAFGAMKEYTAFYFLRLVLSLGLAWAGVTWYGMWGAAISSVAALYVVTALQLRTVTRLLQVPFRRILPFAEMGKITIASIAAAVPAFAAAQWLTRPVVALLAGGLAFAGIFGAMALWLGIVRRQEVHHRLNELWKAIRRFCFRK